MRCFESDYPFSEDSCLRSKTAQKAILHIRIPLNIGSLVTMRRGAMTKSIAKTASILLGILLLVGLQSRAAIITFNFTGSYATWGVPLDVTQISFSLTGASGGNSYGAYTVYGGLGATITGNLSVTSGQTLYIFVGGYGDDSNATALGGFNGGGAGSIGTGSGGGGATDIRLGNSDMAYRVAVAGGGGGASSQLGYGGGGGNVGPFNASLGIGSNSSKGGGGGGYYGGAEGFFNGRGGSNYSDPSATSVTSTDGLDRMTSEKVNGSATITTVPEPSTGFLFLLGVSAIFGIRKLRKA